MRCSSVCDIGGPFSPYVAGRTAVEIKTPEGNQGVMGTVFAVAIESYL